MLSGETVMIYLKFSSRFIVLEQLLAEVKKKMGAGGCKSLSLILPCGPTTAHWPL